MCNDDANFIDMTSDFVNVEGKSSHFREFSVAEWQAVFGSFSNDGVFAVKQCRDGEAVLPNPVNVRVFDDQHGVHGRYDSNAQEGQWHSNDIIVAPGTPCPLEEDYFIKVLDVDECAALCTNDPDCVSFELKDNNKCRISDTCDHYSLTEEEDESNTGNWFFKHVHPSGYTFYPASHCKNEKEIQDETHVNSVQECANLCSTDRGCVSFIYDVPQKDCRLFSICDSHEEMESLEQEITSLTGLYIKEEVDDNDECPIMFFDKAEVSSYDNFFSLFW